MEFGAVVTTDAAAYLMILTETPPNDILRQTSISRLLARGNLTGRWPKSLGFGALTGAAMVSVIMLSLAALGDTKTAFIEPSPGLLQNQIIFLVAFAVVGFAEEFSFRGYAQQALSDSLGFRSASILTSLWFMWIHLQEGDPLSGAIGVFLVGMFFCLTLRITGNLAFAVRFHAAWNYMESAIFGVGNSSFTFDGTLAVSTASGPTWLTGGVVGPEASAPYFVLILGLIIILRNDRQARPRSQSP